METRLPFKFIVAISFLAIIIVNQTGIRLAEAGFLPVPESKETVEARLASDGTRLLVFYSYLDPQQDPFHPDYKYGKIKEWDGAQWQDLKDNDFYGNFIVDNFDLAVQGNIIIDAWQGADGGGQIHCDWFLNGGWGGITTVLLPTSVPHDPRVAFAFGLPYFTYIYNGKVYFDNPQTPQYIGLPPLQNPIFRAFDDILVNRAVLQSALTGDANAIYYAFASQSGPTAAGSGCISVGEQTMTSVIWLGDPIAGIHPHNPEIVLWGAAPTPVAAWVEDPNYIYLAKWEPGTTSWSQYTLSCTGTVGRLRMGVFGDTLYLGVQLDQGSPATEIDLCKWENFSTWSCQTVPLASSNPANVSFQGLAIYKGNPVVAFIDQGVLKIVQSSGGNFAPLNIAPIINFLLAD
jgi:hypothetical protein